MRVAGMVGKFATANSPRAFETVLSSTRTPPQFAAGRSR